MRIAILASQQKEAEIKSLTAEGHVGAKSGVLEKYDDLFVAYNDALEGVRHLPTSPHISPHLPTSPHITRSRGGAD